MKLNYCSRPARDKHNLGIADEWRVFLRQVATVSCFIFGETPFKIRTSGGLVHMNFSNDVGAELPGISVVLCLHYENST